ncbi:MAG TPA: hypothetical protein VEA59_00285 [Patescibacteria group bacterium]|nr:hypothetical protein [Patescibacteria group bacterium]
MTDKQNKIKNLLETTKVLDAAEKQEWLTLLPLMNDKQLIDLESLLSVSAAPQEPVAKREPLKSVGPPKIVSTQRPMDLSYINADPRVVDGIKPLPHEPLPVPPPAPKPTPAQPLPVEPTPPPPGAQSILSTQAPPPVPQPPQVPIPGDKPVDSRSESGMTKEEPGVAKVVPSGPFNAPKSAQDIMALGPDAVKAGAVGTLVGVLQHFITSWGYFNLLFLVHKSPLYAAYLTYGQNKLDGKPDNTFTDAEFSQLIDMFLALRKIA